MSEHFVIQVTVKRVTKADPPTGSYARNNPPTDPGREIEDVVNMTVKGNTAEDAVAKATKLLEVAL